MIVSSWVLIVSSWVVICSRSTPWTTVKIVSTNISTRSSAVIASTKPGQIVDEKRCAEDPRDRRIGLALAAGGVAAQQVVAERVAKARGADRAGQHQDVGAQIGHRLVPAIG